MAKKDANSACKGMREHAAEQAFALLRRLAYQVGHAARQPDADAIHDLRVAIRRFSQCLRVFGELFPAGKIRKMRRRMKRVMDAAAEVRNRDIAIELLRAAGLPAGAAILRRLSAQRDEAEQAFRARIERLSRRNFSRKWRARLSV